MKSAANATVGAQCEARGSAARARSRSPGCERSKPRIAGQAVLPKRAEKAAVKRRASS